MNVEDVKKIGVLGAGTMGSGIAQVVASNGKDIVLLDVSDSSLGRGMKIIGDSLARFVKRERWKKKIEIPFYLEFTQPRDLRT